jgi:Domain of unknown function (DUF4260)
MATTIVNSVSGKPVTGSLRVWLRLEGFSAFMLAVYLYRQMHASWLLFAILFLAPDLSMLGYLAGSRAGAAVYNAVHSYILPLALTAFAILADHHAVLPYALIWIAHIGFDRTLGYGLKYASGFGHTHLGWNGKQRMEESAGSS